jgi:hypothetical protein
MSEEPPPEHLLDGYNIEPLPYIPPSSSPPETHAERQTASARPASDPASHVAHEPAAAEKLPLPLSHSKKRRTLWIVGSIASILLLVIASIVLVDMSISTPDKTLGTFCHALQSEDYHTAYMQFSPQLQAVISEPAFANIFAHDKVTTCIYSAINEKGNSATAGLELVHASKGINRDGITLAQDNEHDWKIADFYRQT